MPDPEFNAKQQQFNQKITSSKSLCQNLVAGAFFEDEKIVRKCCFTVKSEKSLIIIQSNTTNDSIHPPVVATILRFYSKCFLRGCLLKGFHNVHLHWRHPSSFKSLLFMKGSGLCPLFVFVIHPSYYHVCTLWFGNCTSL